MIVIDKWWGSEILVAFPNESVIHELFQPEVEDRLAHATWFLAPNKCIRVSARFSSFAIILSDATCRLAEIWSDTDGFFPVRKREWFCYAN